MSPKGIFWYIGRKKKDFFMQMGHKLQFHCQECNEPIVFSVLDRENFSAVVVCSQCRRKYVFEDETLLRHLKQFEARILGYQNVKENGLATTRYILEAEEGKNWTKILNIHFKDKQHITATSALEAMEQERVLSPDAKSLLITQTINDCLYERSFPTGEHEIVRMIMTKKGLHRVAYIKRGSFDESERRDWIARLMSGVVGQ